MWIRTSSNYYFMRIVHRRYHIYNVYPQCGYEHISSNYNLMRIVHHRYNIYKVYHQCGYGHVASNEPCDRIVRHRYDICVVSKFEFRLIIGVRKGHRRLLLNSPLADTPTSSSLTYCFCRNRLWKYVKYCLLTIMVYLLAMQCIHVFNYICFNAFHPFLRELCCVAYRLASCLGDCKQIASQIGNMARRNGGALCCVL